MNNPDTQIMPWQTPSLLDGDSVAQQELTDSQREMLEEISNQAREEGFAAGREQAYAEHNEKLQHKTAELDHLLDAIGKPFSTLDIAVVEELAAFAGLIARQLVGQELTTSPELILQMVRETIALLPEDHQHIKVTLNHEDAASLRELSSSAELEHGWELIHDSALARGDCQINMGASRIDATLEKRTQAMLADALAQHEEQEQEQEQEQH